MKKILITGAYGFIGRNLVATLERDEELELLKYGSKHSMEQLIEYATQADFVFHLAGVNRPERVEEFREGNLEFTRHLLHALGDSPKKPPIVFASSIQAEQDNAYGESKYGAEKLILSYSKNNQVPVYIFRLPNVFGKWSRPNYNSVIATWCYNIARNIPIQVNNPQTYVNLVYIDDVIQQFAQVMKELPNVDNDPYVTLPQLFNVSLGQIEANLRAFKDSRKTLMLPNLNNEFDKYLYSTYLSYLPTDDFGYELEMKTDQRGWLAEFIKTESAGQIFISRTKPGITRGNHWHHTKVEKFLVIEGEAVIRFRHIETEEVVEYQVSGTRVQVVDIPPGFTHSITNIGTSDVITLFWANERFDPQKPDTYFLEV